MVYLPDEHTKLVCRPRDIQYVRSLVYSTNVREQTLKSVFANEHKNFRSFVGV